MSVLFQPAQLRGFRDIEDLYETFNTHLSEKNNIAIIDIRHIDFLPLEALMSLLCMSKIWFISTGSKVRWNVHENVALYLERADVLDVFSQFIELADVPDSQWNRGLSVNLMEIRSVAKTEQKNSLDVSNLIGSVSSLLLGRASTKQIGGTNTIVSEVAQNVIHSQSGGYALVQSYQPQGKSRVHIGIIDTGIGIANSLSTKYPDITNQSEYIKLSMESGVTSKSSSDGLGLYHVNTIIRNNRGALSIRSGSAMLQYYRGQLFQWDDLANIQGTQVYITLWGENEDDKWQYLLSK